MELPLPMSGETGSNMWQFDSKTEKVPSLSLGQGTLTNTWVPKTYFKILIPLHNDNIPPPFFANLILLLLKN